MPKLHLGVMDLPYAAPQRTRLASSGRGRNKKLRPIKIPVASQTTGDVAEILEAKYHVMEVFWEQHGGRIADALTQDMSDFLDDVAAGSGRNAPTFTAAESVAKTEFVKFIDTKEMDRLGIPGVPTEASLRGVNHRFLHPYAKSNPVRPSLKDTGTYEDSFTAWFDLDG